MRRMKGQHYGCSSIHIFNFNHSSSSCGVGTSGSIGLLTIVLRRMVCFDIKMEIKRDGKEENKRQNEE